MVADMAGLANCHSIADLKARAKRRLPKAVFDFIEGGAEDEVSVRANETGFGRYELIPRTLVDVSRVNLATEVMGQRIDLPFFLSPTGLTRTFHHEGERAVASAAVVWVMTTMPSRKIPSPPAAVQIPDMVYWHFKNASSSATSAAIRASAGASRNPCR